MKRLFMCGAGGTGKTALSVMKDMLDSKFGSSIRVVWEPSISRSFYKLRGITTEKEMLEKSAEEKLQFQLDLFNFYCESTSTTILSAEEKAADLLVFERSPLDHIAYCLYSGAELMTHAQLQELYSKAQDLLEYTTVSTEKYYFTMLKFPAWASWMTKERVNDGMRFAPEGKNFVIDALIEQGLKVTNIPDSMILRLAAESTIEDRAKHVLRYLNYVG